MRNMESILLGSALAFGLFIGHQAEAEAQDCSFAKWDGAAPTVPGDAVGTPNSAPPIARYSEFCGLAVSATGYVQTPDTSDATYFGRFYVHLGSTISDDPDILIAYSGANPVFTVSYDGANFLFDADGGGNGSAPANAGEWNLVEFEYNAEGNINVWVNEQWDFAEVGPAYVTGPTGTFANSSDPITSVRLGAPNGVTDGTLTFDAYEAHRTTNVGALLACDAEGDNDIDINDVLAVVDEVFGDPQVLASGQPDCDPNGSININDALDIVDIVF